MTTLDYPIDVNGDLRLKLTRNGDIVHAKIESRYAPTNSKLVSHLLPLIKASTGFSPATMINGTFTPSVTPTQAEFDIPIRNDNGLLSFTINNINFGQFDISGNSIAESTVTPVRKLTVFETRTIGRSPQTGAPFAIRTPLDPLIKAPKHYSPITDLHTHLSGQITAADLMHIGIEHNVLYPVAALKEAGICEGVDYPADIPKHSVKRMVFLPKAHLPQPKDPNEPAIALSDLSEATRKKLTQAMSLSPEDQCTYEDMEVCYYLREPFTKNLSILPDILLKVAQDYKKQGIEYAELSTNSVMDPAWLKVIHQVMPDIEEKTGVKLRFLAGIPRNLSDDAISERIEKYKIIADSPYIVGVDILGYEMNKTSHLHTHLETIAQWMQHRPDQVLRVHAGENSKNSGNVEDCLKLAEKYHINLRIGHAVYGIDDNVINRMKTLGERGKLMVEFNPDSNLANNNIDMPDEVPIANFIHHGIPSILSSDGAGMYRTDAQQTMMAGKFSGLIAGGSLNIHLIEQSHILEQMLHFSNKLHRIAPDFLETMTTNISEISTRYKAAAPTAIISQAQPIADTQPPIPTDRTPILIAGAAGGSWNGEGSKAHVGHASQIEAKVGLRMMLDYCDPKKVYFVTGRTKDNGMGIELCKAVAEYNATHPDNPFFCLQLEASNKPPGQLPDGVTRWEKLEQPLLNLPTAMLKFIHGTEPEKGRESRNGFAYFVGGHSFTRDFILEFEKSGARYAMMNSPDITGASADKARIYQDPCKTFSDAIDMVKHLPSADLLKKPDPSLPSQFPSDDQLKASYDMHRDALSHRAARSA